MAAAFGGLPPTAMGQATSAVNVVQRIAGALGSAMLAVILQQAVTARLPGFQGRIGQAAALAASSRTRRMPSRAHSPSASPSPRYGDGCPAASARVQQL
jgi:hypothetical protein